MAVVNKIIPFSSVDGPGNRTAIFFQGCNIDCKYCHNPETRPIISANEKVGHELDALAGFENDLSGVTDMTVDQVIEEIKKQMPFIRGVTVSGGECMLNSDFLTELFGKVKALGLTTLIDTNGTIPFKGKEKLLEYTDGVMLDVKAYDEADHINVTGAGNKVVLENLDYLISLDKLFEIRCVIAPRLYNGMKSVLALANHILNITEKKSFHFKLIKYRPMGVRAEYRDMPSPSDKYLQTIENMLEDMGFEGTVIS